MSLMLTIENNSEISCTKGMLLPDWVDLHRAEPWCRVGHASVDAHCTRPAAVAQKGELGQGSLPVAGLRLKCI